MFSALQFAGRLPFRPGASRAIVAVTCSPTLDDHDDKSTFNYGDALTMLREQSISLHHLKTREEFGFRKRKKSAKRIIGYNSEEVFFAGSSSSSLRRHLKPPKDLISALASESSGSVFQQRTEAVATFSEQVAKALSGPDRQILAISKIPQKLNYFLQVSDLRLPLRRRWAWPPPMPQVHPA